MERSGARCPGALSSKAVSVTERWWLRATSAHRCLWQISEWPGEGKIEGGGGARRGG